MSVSKRKSWKKGEYAFHVKIIYPDGAEIEVDCENVDIVRGESFVKAMYPHLFGKPAPKEGL